MAVTHVTSGAGAPTIAPPSISAHYTDTSTNDQYISIGVASTADWIKQSRAADLTAHINHSDPHPQYATPAEAAAAAPVQSVDGKTGTVTLSTTYAPLSHIGSGGAVHADATISESGFMSAADKGKLDGVAAAATANQDDAYLLDRANHTGTQAIGTVTSLQSSLDAKVTRPVVVSDAGTAITLTLAAADQYIRTTAADAVNIVVPPQVDAAWLDYTEIHIEQAGAGVVTFAPGAGVTINKLTATTYAIVGQYGVVTLKRVGVDVWTLFGALGAA